MLREMPQRRLKPGVISYSTTTGACEKVGQWEAVLGLLRENLRASLASGIRLKELARNYTGFSAADLQQQLESSNMLQV